MNKKINYTDEGEVTIPEEKNKKKTGLRWKKKKPKKFKYVDDGMICSKINMDSGLVQVRNGRTFKIKHDLQTQNMFSRVVGRATDRGMVVNSAKTKVLCVSDSQTYTAECKFEDSDGTSIESGTHLKILGFHMDGQPSCHAHVEALRVQSLIHI